MTDSTRQALTLGDLARRYRLNRDTPRGWALPAPDVALGRSTGWWPETIDAWVAEHRPDLLADGGAKVLDQHHA